MTLNIYTFQPASAVLVEKEDDEESRAVKSIILDKNESEILERITRTTQEAESNKNGSDPKRTSSSQVSRHLETYMSFFRKRKI